MATVTKKPRSKPPATRSKAKASAARPAAKRAAAPVAKAGKPAPAKQRSGTTVSAAEVDEPERSSAPMAEVDAEVLEFIAAIDTFKKQHGRPFPSWSEVLLIVRQLGYRR